ncbi:MAG TPA: hypothetical protein VMR25_09135 [Planctomycetaceae bacterium]|jgi:DNA-binding CsgD family transcriptional regulator|nr:hypothetical protein [Planctomycetaceae bacterium]
MIAPASKTRCKACSPRWNDRFLQLLPAIQEQAEFAFRGVSVELREELIQEVIAAAYVLFTSLWRRGKADLIYATPLAKFAVRHVRDGRRIGSRSNSRDITSPRAREAKGIVIERIERFNRRRGEWREVLLEDRTAGPAEIAMTRLDFASWLSTLSNRDRQLAEKLALGETTGCVARMFRISVARVSQLRRELCRKWQKFIGEPADASRPRIATA